MRKGAGGKGQSEENAVVAVRPLQALHRHIDENASRVRTFRKDVPLPGNKTDSAYHHYDELVQLFRQKRAGEVKQVTSRLLSPAGDYPVFLLLGDGSTVVSPPSHRTQESQEDDAHQSGNGSLRSVTPPACLAPAGCSKAVVVYGALPEEDLFLPSIPAMYPVHPVPVGKERAGELYGMVVTDGRRDKVQLRTTDRNMALGFLYLAVLVLVRSTALAARRRLMEKKRERIAAKPAAAAERRAHEAKHTAVVAQGLWTSENDRVIEVETDGNGRLHSAVMAQHDAESMVKHAMAERDEWCTRYREMTASSEVMERERDRIRKERDQLAVQNQRLVADNTALKRRKGRLEAAEARAHRAAEQVAQKLASAEALVASLMESAALGHRLDASHKHAESVEAELELSNAANMSNQAFATGQAHGCRMPSARERQNAYARGRAEGLATGRAEGKVEGRAEGRDEGRAEGRAEGKAEGLADGWNDGAADIIRNVTEEGSEHRNTSWVASELCAAFGDPLRMFTAAEAPSRLGVQDDGTFSQMSIGSVGREAGMRIAVKAAPREEEYERETTRREIRALRELRGHPFIVSYLGHCTAPTKTCIYMAGADMDLTGAATLTASDPRAHKWTVQLLSALQYMAEKNMVHRDIKPANVLLRHDNIKLADMGFATPLTDDNPALTTFIGTPGYMAPEVLLRRRHCYPVDMWGVGMVIFHMLHDTTPFWPGSTASPDDYKNERWIEQETQNVLTGTFVTPIAAPVVASGCGDLIRRLLHTDPARRLTVFDAFRHPWIISDGVVLQNTRNKVKSELRNHAIATDRDIGRRLQILAKDL